MPQFEEAFRPSMIRIALEPSPLPEGRRLEDISAGGEVTAQMVDGWLRDEEEAERRDELRNSLWLLVVCVPLLIGVMLLPEGSDGESLHIPTVMLGCAAFFALIGGVELLWQRRVMRWVPTTAKIVATAIRRADRLWAPAVFFEYTVEGTTHRVNTVGIDGRPHSSPDQADRVRSRYQPGERRRCYYSPRNPSQAVLDRRLYYRDARIMGALAAATAVASLFF